eukprot:5696654-Amphidinium_carterae.1
MNSSSCVSGEERLAVSNTPWGDSQLTAPGRLGKQDQIHADSSAVSLPMTTPPRSVVASVAVITRAGGRLKSHAKGGQREISTSNSSWAPLVSLTLFCPSRRPCRGR